MPDTGIQLDYASGSTSEATRPPACNTRSLQVGIIFHCTFSASLLATGVKCFIAVPIHDGTSASQTTISWQAISLSLLLPFLRLMLSAAPDMTPVGMNSQNCRNAASQSHHKHIVLLMVQLLAACCAPARKANAQFAVHTGVSSVL